MSSLYEIAGMPLEAYGHQVQVFWKPIGLLKKIREVPASCSGKRAFFGFNKKGFSIGSILTKKSIENIRSTLIYIFLLFNFVIYTIYYQKAE